MAGQAKIEILANADKATKEFQKLSNSIKDIEKDASTLTKAVNTGDYNKLSAYLDAQAQKFTLIDGKAKGATESYNLYNKALKMASENQSYSVEQLTALAAKTDKYAKSINESSVNTQKFAKAEEQAGKASGLFNMKLLEVTANILKFRVIMNVINSIARVKDFLKESTKVAAEAEQVWNKLITVYDGFSKSAEKSAQALASTLGVAGSTAAQSLGTIGDLLQAQGMGVAESLETASEWAKQLQDIIAFKDLNMSLEEFAQTFMSGAAGNLRNFRTFGSIVKESAVNARLAQEGLDKLTGQQLELAKMTTRANMALEQQANAIGATEREWDTVLSINRRLNEEQKRLKENLGAEINEALKPLKRWWVDLLDSINNAIEAKKEYNAILLGKETADAISPYDPINNDKDFKEYQNRIKSEYNALFVGSQQFVDPKEKRQYMEIVTDKIYKMSVAFGGNVSTLTEVLGKKLEDWQIELLKGLEKQTSQLKAENERREQNGAQANVLIDKYNSFNDALSNIFGVGIVGRSYGQEDIDYATNKGTDRLSANIENQVIADISLAMENIANAGADEMRKSMEYALGTFTDNDVIKMQIESTKALYEAAWNEFQSGGVTDEERAVLTEIVGKYNELNEVLNTNIEYEKAQESIKGELAKSSDSMKAESDYNKLLESFKIGRSDEAAKIMTDWDIEIKKVKESFVKLGATTFEYEDKMYTQDELLAQVNEKYREQMEALDESNEEIKNAFSDWGLLGDVGSLIQAGISASANGQSPLLAILAEILGKLEIIDEISALLDPIIDNLNAMLRPLMPVLQMIGETINMLMESVGGIIFDVIKVIAEAVVALMTPIKIVAAVIKNIFTAVHNILEWIMHPANKNKRDIWGYESLSDVVNEQVDLMKRIWNATYHIEQNTEKDNDLLSVYNEMYKRELINGSEYNALVGSISGINNDRLHYWENGVFQNGSNGTTIAYTGGVQIVIDGSNLDAEQIALKVEQVLTRRSAVGGASTF